MVENIKQELEALHKAIDAAVSLEERAELEDQLEALQRKYLNGGN